MDTFDVLIFSFVDVLITFINLFDVVIVVRFFDVLFGFRRCEIRSSDLFPISLPTYLPPTNELKRIDKRKLLLTKQIIYKKRIGSISRLDQVKSYCNESKFI